MKLHRFFLQVGGQTLELPDSIDSAGLAQEQAERQAEATGRVVLFYSQTLLGMINPDRSAQRLLHQGPAKPGGQ